MTDSSTILAPSAAKTRGIVITTVKSTGNLVMVSSTSSLNTSINTNKTDITDSITKPESSDKITEDPKVSVTITTSNSENINDPISSTAATNSLTTDTPFSTSTVNTTLPTRWSPHLRFGANSGTRENNRKNVVEINRKMMLLLLAYIIVGCVLF